MEPLVSVIILPSEDNAYLVRCINSIKRQTYKNIEIIVSGITNTGSSLGEGIKVMELSSNDVCEKINAAINNAKGEYVLFCNITSIMSPGYIALLLDTCKSSFPVGKVYKKTNELIEESVLDDLLIIGKLFDKSILVNERIKFDGAATCPELAFLQSYKKYCLEIKCCKEACLYTQDDTVKWNVEVDIEQVKELLVALKEVLSIELFEKNVVTIFDKALAGKLLERVRLAMHIVSSYGDCPFCNIEIVRTHLKGIYEGCLQDENEELWNTLKCYFASIASPHLLTNILNEFNLKKEHVELIKSCSVREFIYYKDKISFESDKRIECSNVEFLKEIKEIKSKIDNLRVQIPMSKEQEIVYIEKKLQGVELGEYVLQEYRAGRLGFGYVIKFLKAYIQYKIKK